MLKPPAFSRILVMLVGPVGAGASAGGAGTTTGLVSDGRLLVVSERPPGWLLLGQQQGLGLGFWWSGK